MGYVLPSSGCLSVCVATMLGCNSRMVSFCIGGTLTEAPAKGEANF